MSQRRSQDLLKDGVETGSLNFASPFAEQASASLDPALDRVCGEALSQLAAGERARLLSDGILNSGPFVASGVVGIILVPILLHGLGAELYGLWIYASSAAAVVGLADPGLGWSLTREVARAEARCRNETGDDAAARLVNNIAIVYLILGSSGALLISVLGLILVPGLHLSPSNSETAALVFCLIGASFLGDTMNDFGAGVLHGLRIFDITSAIAIIDTLITDGGIIALILAGKRLEYVAAWCALISLGTALVSIGLGAYVAPRYGIRPIRFSWQTISPHIEFGIKSQFASGMHQAGWSFMQLVVGIFTGPAMVAIYDVGQKFPSFLRATGGFLSQTISPSASSCTDENQRKLGQGIVETGLREVFLITTPLFLSVGILAPSLLNIWLGKVSTEAVWVLRLTLLAAWLDCVGGSPLHFLWGSGALDGILAVLGAGAIVNLGLSILLITKLGVAGAALATVIVGGAICVTLLGMGARAVGAEWSAMLRRAWKGLGIPTAVCAAVVVSTHYMAGANRAGEFILLCGVAASAYAVAVLARGLREEEWVVFGQLVAAPSRKLMSRFYRGLRRIGFP
jgi:O-antigen/teichoic acid export membrane protein